MSRDLIIVDCESTGLRSEDIAVEIAWWNLDTDERGSFIPQHDEKWALNFAQDKALEINGYRARILGKSQDDGAETQRLFNALEGNTLAGSNPTADAAWLEKLFVDLIHLDDVVTPPRPWAPWHHRMWDLSAYAAGVLGLDELPGLWGTCQLLGIDDEGALHTAESGVTTTGLCFKRLREIAATHKTKEAAA